MRLHTAKLVKFIERYDFFILTTHDPADADGLGAQLVLACILRKQKKKFRIINASAIPKNFKFMDPRGVIEEWDSAQHEKLLKRAGLFLVDTAEKGMTGKMEEELCRAKEVFIIDHHQPGPHADFDGLNDPSAASTCELTVALAKILGVTIDSHAAFAAYIGIAYDTGFFAYPNTGPRTFHAAMLLQKLGVKPIKVYQHLHENASVGVLLLQQRALAGMTLHCHNRVAVQILRLKDFAETGTLQEDTEGFVNFPLKANEIVVSLLLKESPDGKIRCSLRSKGSINVAKAAQELNGGGHINAAGFKSKIDIDQTCTIALQKISKLLERP